MSSLYSRSARGVGLPTAFVATVVATEILTKSDRSNETQTTMPIDKVHDYPLNHWHGEDKVDCAVAVRDNRPEWQKIGDRKGRSRPNKKR